MGMISVELDLRLQTAAGPGSGAAPEPCAPRAGECRREADGCWRPRRTGASGRARAVVPQRLASDGVPTQVLRWVFGDGSWEGCASGDCAAGDCVLAGC